MKDIDIPTATQNKDVSKTSYDSLSLESMANSLSNNFNFLAKKLTNSQLLYNLGINIFRTSERRTDRLLHCARVEEVIPEPAPPLIPVDQTVLDIANDQL